MRKNLFFSLLLLILAGAPVLRAQVSASLAGVIRDPSGARIAGASITVTNVETGAARPSVTDDAGRYEVLALPVGEYKISVSKAGFQEQ
ncbi:MAG: carboxypeptidase-like regulatory domain-containing protein, partial [Candidatus Acidiferrum sp.]